MLRLIGRGEICFDLPVTLSVSCWISDLIIAALRRNVQKVKIKLRQKYCIVLNDVTRKIQFQNGYGSGVTVLQRKYNNVI